MKAIGNLIDFVGNCIVESTTYFCFYPKFQFKAFIEVKICEKPFLASKEILFSKADFQINTY